MEISCIILAGGPSKRLREKTFLKLEGKLLIEYPLEIMKKFFSDIVIVVKEKEQKIRLGRILPEKIVTDNSKLHSPMAGVKEGIKHIVNEYVLIVASDMPFVSEDLIGKLVSKVDGKVDCVVPKLEFYEPLCSIYKKEIFKSVGLEESFHRLIDKQKNKVFVKAEKLNFFNVNTEEDLNFARKLVSQIFL